MADSKLSDLPSGTPADADLLYLVQGGVSKKTTVGGVTALSAPTSATYVTLSTNGTLTNERVLTAGAGVSLTDAGAGSTVTVANTDGGTAAVAAHVAEADPHPQYLQTDGDGSALTDLDADAITGGSQTGTGALVRAIQALLAGVVTITPEASNDTLILKTRTGRLALKVRNVGDTADVVTVNEVGTITANGNFEAVASFRVLTFGSYVGVLGGSRFEFENGRVRGHTPLVLGTHTVATLPAASSNDGAIAQVTDSSVTTGVVAGGGSNRVMVFSTNSEWRVVCTLTLGDSATRNVGTGAGTVAAGDDSRFTDARTPTGAAGGVLGGTYPNPTQVVAASVFIETPTATTLTISAKAAFALTLNQIRGLKTSAGTATVSIQINGTNVTGLGSLAVTTTPQDATATAANAVAAGDRVTLVVTSPSSAAGLEFTLQGTR